MILLGTSITSPDPRKLYSLNLETCELGKLFKIIDPIGFEYGFEIVAELIGGGILNSVIIGLCDTEWIIWDPIWGAGSSKGKGGTWAISTGEICWIGFPITSEWATGFKIGLILLEIGSKFEVGIIRGLISGPEIFSWECNIGGINPGFGESIFEETIFDLGIDIG